MPARNNCQGANKSRQPAPKPMTAIEFKLKLQQETLQGVSDEWFGVGTHGFDMEGGIPGRDSKCGKQWHGKTIEASATLKCHASVDSSKQSTLSGPAAAANQKKQ